MPAVSIAHVLERLIVKAPRGRNPRRVEDTSQWNAAASQSCSKGAKALRKVALRGSAHFDVSVSAEA
jgi:hypothetical protein